MNAADNMTARTKIIEDASTPSRTRVTMSPMAISMLVALQFLWFFILGGVFYGYLDSQRSLKSVEEKLAQTEKNVSLLAAQVSRREAFTKTANKKVSPEFTSVVKSNETALNEAGEKSKSTTAGNPIANQNHSAVTEINSSVASPAREILHHTEQYHKVNAGETLYKISQHYKISVAEINLLNNLKQDQPILPGQKLLVAPVKH